MIDLLTASPVLFICVAFLFALLIGSFLNVVIYRLPVMMQLEWRQQCAELAAEPAPDVPDGRFDLVAPRSRCPSCNAPISAWQNIPVLSYLLLKGRCASCKKSISVRYPIIEFLTALLAAIVAWRFGFGLETLFAIGMTFALIAISVIDIDHQLIPDSIVLPLMWVGLAMSLLHPVAGSQVLFIAPAAAIGGALLGYLILWSVYQAFKLLTGKEGMGYGDFKLLAALGAWLGWMQVPLIILMSAIVGATVGIMLIVTRGRDRNIPMPFGPYLAAAGWLMMLWGDAITRFFIAAQHYLVGLIT